jgi:hypothetical protein
VTRAELFKVLSPHIRGRFKIVKSKNKGKAKFTHATIELTNLQDFNNLLQIKRLRIETGTPALKRGCYGNREQKFFTRAPGAPEDLLAALDQRNFCFFEMERFKSIEERLVSVKEILGKRLYVDGLGLWARSQAEEEPEIERLRMELERFFNAFGFVKDVFLKVKEDRVLCFVTFDKFEAVEKCLEAAERQQRYDGSSIYWMDFNGSAISIGRKEEKFGRMKMARSQTDEKHYISPFWRREAPKKVQSNSPRVRGRFQKKPKPRRISIFGDPQSPPRTRKQRQGRRYLDSPSQSLSPEPKILQHHYHLEPFIPLARPNHQIDWMGMPKLSIFSLSHLAKFKPNRPQSFGNFLDNQQHDRQGLLSQPDWGSFPLHLEHGVGLRISHKKKKTELKGKLKERSFGELIDHRGKKIRLNTAVRR